MSKEKAELRQHMRALRKTLSLSAQDEENITAAITKIIKDNTPAPILALYKKAGGEISPANLSRYAAAHNIPCTYPHTNNAEKTMHFETEAGETLTPTIIITPLIAFDRNGNRLGQGGGYYDRYFEQHPNTLKIGLAYAEQETEKIPTEPHDQKLNWIITPKEAIHIK